MKLGNWMRSSLNRPLPVMMDPLKGVAEATEGEREAQWVDDFRKSVG